MKRTHLLPRILALFLSLSLILPNPAFALRNLEIRNNAAGVEALENRLKVSSIAAGTEDKDKDKDKDKKKPGMSTRRKFFWTVAVGSTAYLVLAKINEWWPFAPEPEPPAPNLGAEPEGVRSMTPTEIRLKLNLTADLTTLAANQALVAVPFTRTAEGGWQMLRPEEGEGSTGFQVIVDGRITVRTTPENPFEGRDSEGRQVVERAVMLVNIGVFENFLGNFRIGQGRRPPMGPWMAGGISSGIVLIANDGQMRVVQQLPNQPVPLDAGTEQTHRVNTSQTAEGYPIVVKEFSNVWDLSDGTPSSILWTVRDNHARWIRSAAEGELFLVKFDMFHERAEPGHPVFYLVRVSGGKIQALAPGQFELQGKLPWEYPSAVKVKPGAWDRPAAQGRFWIRIPEIGMRIARLPVKIPLLVSTNLLRFKWQDHIADVSAVRLLRGSISDRAEPSSADVVKVLVDFLGSADLAGELVMRVGNKIDSRSFRDVEELLARGERVMEVRKMPGRHMHSFQVNPKLEEASSTKPSGPVYVEPGSVSRATISAMVDQGWNLLPWNKLTPDKLQELAKAPADAFAPSVMVIARPETAEKLAEGFSARSPVALISADEQALKELTPLAVLDYLLQVLEKAERLPGTFLYYRLEGVFTLPNLKAAFLIAEQA